MKKVKLLSMLAASVMFLGSCSDDQTDISVVENPVKGGEEVVFGSSLSKSSIETRTIYGGEESTGGDYDKGYFNVYWEDGDTITILCPQASNGTRVDYTITPLNGDKTTSADVTKLDPDKAGLQWNSNVDEHEFFAFYPAKAITGEAVPDDGIVTVNIPVEQDPVKWEKRGDNTWVGIADTDYAYMWAYNKVKKSLTPQGTSISLPFKPMTTVLEITVNGPKSSSQTVSQVTVTSVAPASADNPNTILSGLVKCNIRAAAENNGNAICETAGNLNEVRNRIAVNLYNAKGDGKYPTLYPGEKLKVYVSIMPKDESIVKGNLKVTVAGVNTPAKEKTLQTGTILAHAINKVSLPALDATGSYTDINYWMSNLDPDIYYSELSLPGSKSSMATKNYNSDYYMQGVSMTEQFKAGVRAFDFETKVHSYWDWGTKYDRIDVTIETQLSGGSITPLKNALLELANCLEMAEKDGKKQESIFVNLSYGAPKLLGELFADEKNWVKYLSEFANDWTNGRVYDGEINANTTLGDVAGKIILRIHAREQDAYNSFTTNLPAQLVRYNDPCSVMENEETGVKTTTLVDISWGTASHTTGTQLFYQDASRLDSKGGILDLSSFDGDIDSKKSQVKDIVEASVEAYNNNQSHNIWYMMDVGGYFYEANVGGLLGEKYDSESVATTLTPYFFTFFNVREQNASLGAVYMNFADNDPNFGAKFGSNVLIQTIINNNFTFQLRTRGSGTYTSTQTRGVSAGNDDPNSWD